MNLTHIQAWIEEKLMSGTDEEIYAAFFFHLKTLPAVYRMAFDRLTEDMQLFCEYEGKPYRVTGASRLGDIWLTSDFNQSIDYELRVDVAKCSGWRKKAEK